jgi:hypothetical protein
MPISTRAIVRGPPLGRTTVSLTTGTALSFTAGRGVSAMCAVAAPAVTNEMQAMTANA